MSEPSTIVLIGAARSGTKFLRDILASGAGTAAVPYDVNYVWRYGAEKAVDDVLDPATLTNKRKQFIRTTLRSLAKARNDDILIEKTVASTLRVPFVDAVFPDARYVHLVRDGREVTESAMRQWQAPPNWSALLQKVRDIPIQNLGYVGWFGWNFVKGLFSGRKGGKVWGPRFPGIDAMVEQGPLARVCAQQWLESYKRARSDLSNIAAADSRVFKIRYEDLIRDDTALSKLVDQLGLPDKDSIIETFHKKLKPNQPEIWRNLPPLDLATIDQVLSPKLRELGYVHAQLVQIIGPIAALSATLFAISAGFDPVIVVLLYTLASPLTQAAWSLVYFAARPAQRPTFGKLDRTSIRAWTGIGGAFFVVSILTAVGMNMDNLIIAARAGTEAVTDFGVPARLGSLLMLIVFTVFMPLWTLFGNALARGDRKWLWRTAVKMSAGGALGVLIVGLTMVTLADSIFLLWMGRSFPDQQRVLMGMVASATVIALTSPFNMILNAAGMARQQIMPWAGFVGLCLVAKTLMVTPETTWWVPWITTAAYAVCVTPRILQLAITRARA